MFVLIIMFIRLTHEYMVKINIKKEHLAVESCSDNDGVPHIRQDGDRVLLVHCFQVLDHLGLGVESWSALLNPPIFTFETS